VGEGVGNKGARREGVGTRRGGPGTRRGLGGGALGITQAQMTAVTSALSAFYNEPLASGDHEAHKVPPLQKPPLPVQPPFPLPLPPLPGAVTVEARGVERAVVGWWGLDLGLSRVR